MKFAHTSVLIQESMGLLKPRPGERYLDGTWGEVGTRRKYFSEAVPMAES
jgi:16S rRNA C1402 N4-methylase RsmH